MKASLIVAVLFIAQFAQARQVIASDRGEMTSEPTLAVCTITRVSLVNSSVMKETVQAPLTFESSAPNTGTARVSFDSNLMPSYRIQFEISFAGKVDATRLMTVNKETGKPVSQYASNSILMNFVSGANVKYTVKPNNSFMTADGKFILDIACGEKI